MTQPGLQRVILRLALQALVDPDVLPVLGDAVIESGWFDPRVMQVMWPLGKAPRHGWRTKRKRDRAKVDREAHKTGYPLMFAGVAASPTTSWARAIAAVLLFGGWRKRRWPMVERCGPPKRQVYSALNASITINGVPFEGFTDISIDREEEAST